MFVKAENFNTVDLSRIDADKYADKSELVHQANPFFERVARHSDLMSPKNMIEPSRYVATSYHD